MTDGPCQPCSPFAEELNGDTIEGATIYGADDHKVGTVSHLHGAGPRAQVVVDVGGFLGIGATPVAVPINDLPFMRDEDGDVDAATTWTKESLKNGSEDRHSS